MSLNTDTRGYDLASRSRAIRSASWAVYWLGEALWCELRGDLNLAIKYATDANTEARVVYGLRSPAATLPMLIAAELY